MSASRGCVGGIPFWGAHRGDWDIIDIGVLRGRCAALFPRTITDTGTEHGTVTVMDGKRGL
ncbi:MAG: hypothetical protein ACLTSZ_03025 [Lachnospiraceae bacterium]